jgi:hypothetical protein
MIWPWVSTAPVAARSTGSRAERSKGVPESIAVARSACHWRLRARTRSRQSAGLLTPARWTASVSAARARLASATIPVAPSRPASYGLTLMLAKRT